MTSPRAVLCALVLCAGAALVRGLPAPPRNLVGSAKGDFEVSEPFLTPAEEDGEAYFDVRTVTDGVVPSTGRTYTAYAAYGADPARQFSVRPPVGSEPEGEMMQGCSTYAKTSETAQEYECTWATNAGFFVMPSTSKDEAADDDSLCLGSLICDGEVVQLDADGMMASVSFAIAPNAEDPAGPDGTYQVLVGFIPSGALAFFNIQNLISGMGWLVRDGVSYIDQTPDLDTSSSFVLEKAPRTAIGLFANGTMILYQVDGEEDIDEGVDLYELTELLLDLGVEHAVNLDGGGSSVSVYNGEVFSQPTCTDTSEICERDVTSITCLKVSSS